MAVNDSDPADDAQAQDDLNPFAIKAVKAEVAEQAEHQENFQTSMRVVFDPDPEATQEFQEELIGLIKHHLSEEDVSLAEVAIGLWDEIVRMEEMFRESDEEESSSDPSDEDDSGVAGRGSSDISDALEKLADGEDDSEAGNQTEADSPDDPAFH